MRLPWNVSQAPVSTTGSVGGRCEVCQEYGIVRLSGLRFFCWEHYGDEMRKQRGHGPHTESANQK